MLWCVSEGPKSTRYTTLSLRLWMFNRLEITVPVGWALNTND